MNEKSKLNSLTDFPIHRPTFPKIPKTTTHNTQIMRKNSKKFGSFIQTLNKDELSRQLRLLPENVLSNITMTSYERVVIYLKELKEYFKLKEGKHKTLTYKHNTSISLNPSTSCPEFEQIKSFSDKISFIMETIQSQKLYDYTEQTLQANGTNEEEYDNLIGFLNSYSNNENASGKVIVLHKHGSTGSNLNNLDKKDELNNQNLMYKVKENLNYVNNTTARKKVKKSKSLKKLGVIKANSAHLLDKKPITNEHVSHTNNLVLTNNMKKKRNKLYGTEKIISEDSFDNEDRLDIIDENLEHMNITMDSNKIVKELNNTKDKDKEINFATTIKPSKLVLKAVTNNLDSSKDLFTKKESRKSSPESNNSANSSNKEDKNEYDIFKISNKNVEISNNENSKHIFTKSTSSYNSNSNNNSCNNLNNKHTKFKLDLSNKKPKMKISHNSKASKESIEHFDVEYSFSKPISSKTIEGIQDIKEINDNIIEKDHSDIENDNENKSSSKANKGAKETTSVNDNDKENNINVELNDLSYKKLDPKITNSKDNANFDIEFKESQIEMFHTGNLDDNSSEKENDISKYSKDASKRHSFINLLPKARTLNPKSSKTLMSFNNSVELMKEELMEIIDPNFDIFNYMNRVGQINVMPTIVNLALENFDDLVIFPKCNDMNNSNNFLSLLDFDKLNSFSVQVREKYLKNPYHNSIHGTDVFLSLYHIFIYSNLIQWSKLTSLDILSSLIAGLTHDIGHPGFNNSFMVNSRSERALTYNDIHVLENYHASEGYKVLINPYTNILSKISAAEFKYFRKRFIQMILSTDPVSHSKICSIIKNKLITHEINEGKNVELMINENRLYDDQQEILDFLISFCDTCHSCKSFEITFNWTTRLMEEFWHQGDVEKELGIPVSFLCERKDAFIGKGQIGFIQGIIYPGARAVTSILPDLNYMLKNLEENVMKWQEYLDNRNKNVGSQKSNNKLRQSNTITS